MTLSITRLDAAAFDRHVDGLAQLLHACVHEGASVSFVLPFAVADAGRFWREKVRPGVTAGTRAVFVAMVEGRLVGTVQLAWDTPPNQPHRADVAKLLIHPHHRRRGLARALMAALEAHARRLGRPLLTLDTRTGDAAEPLYLGLGYTAIGAIPGYSVDPLDPDRLDATTVFYKAL